MMKVAAVQGLNNTPYIKVKWGSSNEAHGALIDTGADWSLMSELMLTEEEKAELGGTDKSCQGVSGEKIKVLGVGDGVQDV